MPTAKYLGIIIKNQTDVKKRNKGKILSRNFTFLFCYGDRFFFQFFHSKKCNNNEQKFFSENCKASIFKIKKNEQIMTDADTLNDYEQNGKNFRSVYVHRNSSVKKRGLRIFSQAIHFFH